jgi:hypothetical protein
MINNQKNRTMIINNLKNNRKYQKKLSKLNSILKRNKIKINIIHKQNKWKNKNRNRNKRWSTNK